MKKVIELKEEPEVEEPRVEEPEQVKPAQKLTDELYNKILAEHEETGKTVKEICDRYGVASSSFYYKKTILKRSQSETREARVVSLDMQGDTSDRVKELEEEVQYWKNKFLDLYVEHDKLKSKL